MSDNADLAAGRLAIRFMEQFPEEASLRLESADPAEAQAMLTRIPPVNAARVIERMTVDAGARVIEEMELDSLKPVLAAIDPAWAATLLTRLDEPAREQRLKLLHPAAAAELKSLMSYEPGSAGSLMDPKVLAFRPEATAGDALDRLRRSGIRRIQDVFLVNGSGELAGSVTLQDIAVAPSDERLKDLVRAVTPRVYATASREEIGETMETSRLATLAVVDAEERLVGAIRQDALFVAAQEEATIDIQTMVGVSRQERALSTPTFAVKKRLPWLSINLGTAFLAAAVVGIFENTIAQVTALAVLLPVVAGQSGNTGAQALAVTMRGLALREIRARQWLRIALKEISVGFLNGLAIAALTSVAVFVWSGSSGLAVVIGTSMVISMVAAGFAGAAIPMLLTALGQDPAQSSSIILTTITDVTGFFSFLGIATLMLRML
ncbi:MAG TPA: magnesium transporter [Terriglobia bacterium]|nr:magnesium transporter [Terriglobia bacterium]